MTVTAAKTPINDQIEAAVIESLTQLGPVVSPRQQQAVAEDFFRRHPEQFIQWLTAYYPLTQADIEEYRDLWHWGNLSSNRSIRMTEQCFEQFVDRWNLRTITESADCHLLEILLRRHENRLFDIISPDEGDLDPSDLYLYEYAASKIPWTECLIERHLDRWNWKLISSLGNYSWSIEFIARHADRLDWGELSSNEHLPWSIELIERFLELWHWDGLSRNEALPWSEDLIEGYTDRWKWEVISWNKCLPWSIELVGNHKTQWCWDNLSRNEALPWSEDLIRTYVDHWDWRSLVLNKELPWSPELVAHFQEYWDWSGLTLLNNSFRTEHLFSAIVPEEWEWEALSFEWPLPWSEELLDTYENRWDWFALSGNTGLPWSEGLVAKYENRWNWDAISSNESLPWSESLLRRFEDRWNWDELARNSAIPWSEYLANKFIHRLGTMPYGMTVSIGFAERHQQLDRYGGIKGAFNRTPAFQSDKPFELSCFNLTRRQVLMLMAECFAAVASLQVE